MSKQLSTKSGASPIGRKLGVNLNSSLIPSGVGVGILRVLSLGLALGISVVAARYLGPEKYGSYALVTSILSVMALVLHGGMPVFLVREVAQIRADTDWPLLNGLMYRILQWIATGSALLFLAIGSVFLVATDSSLHSVPGYLLIGSPMLPLIALNSTRVAILRGLQKPVLSQIPQNLVQPGAQLLCLILAVTFISLTVEVALWCLIISTALAVCVGGFCLIRETRIARGVQRRYETKRWVKGLAPFAALAVISLLSAQVSTLVLGSFSAREEVGYLRIADRMAQLVAFSLLIVNIVVAPHFAERAKKKNWRGLESIARQSVRLAFMSACPVALIFIVFGKSIIGWLYGQEYAGPVWAALVILCVGQLVNVYYGSVANVLNMSGYERDTLKGMFFGLVANFLTAMLLAPSLGATGGAIATTTSFLVWNTYLVWCVQRRIAIKTTPI